MPWGVILSLGITVLCLLLSLIFKIAGKLRLTIPVFYFLVVGFFPPANKWAAANERLALGILFALVGLCFISWLVSLSRRIGEWKHEKRLNKLVSKQIEIAQASGKSPSDFGVDENGILYDRETGESVYD